ncbi:hypothetical protein Ancab_014883, partial [Ancistrocladus abbreviatus]
MAINVDLKKAHDHLDWEFIRDILKAVGFLTHFIEVLRGHYLSSNPNAFLGPSMVADSPPWKGIVATG